MIFPPFNLRLFWQRWRDPQKNLGQRGERLAARYLRQQGYHLLERNLHSHTGEIDLLVLTPDQRCLVIVEVKTSLQSTALRRPEFRVTATKQHKLVTLASQWAKRQSLAALPIRFDVIGIDWPVHGQPVIRHHLHAFEAEM